MRPGGVASGRQTVVKRLIGGTWFAGAGREMPGIGRPKPGSGAGFAPHRDLG